jgi:hypothetical protein
VRLLVISENTVSVYRSLLVRVLDPATRKHSMVVKVTIDEQTAMKLLSIKPNTTPTATFCALLIEYGLIEWENLQAAKKELEAQKKNWQ